MGDKNIVSFEDKLEMGKKLKELGLNEHQALIILTYMVNKIEDTVCDIIEQMGFYDSSADKQVNRRTTEAWLRLTLKNKKVI